MLTDYAPVLILVAIVLAFCAGSLLLSDVLGRHHRNLEKLSPYECGMDPVGGARVRLSIHYYLVAVLFILFDVEAAFLVLWAVSARDFAAGGVGGFVFAEVAVFVLVLVLTLVFVWRKGGLDWDR